MADENQKLPKETATMDRPALIKMAGLMLASLILAAISWWLVSAELTDLRGAFGVPDVGGWLKLLLASILFFISLAINSLLGLLVKLRRWEELFLLLWLVAPLAFFPINLLTWLALVALGGGSFLTSWRLRRDDSSRRQPSIELSLRSAVWFAVTGWTIALSCLYYGQIAIQSQTIDPIDSLAEVSTRTTEQILESRLPGFTPNMSIDEFLFLLVVNQAEQTGEAPLLGDDNVAFDLDQALLQIDPAVLEQLGLPADFDTSVLQDRGELQRLFAEKKDLPVIQQQLGPLRDDLLAKVGITASGDETIHAVLLQTFTTKLRDYVGPFTRFLPPILAITIFFSLQVLNFVYRWLVIGLAILLYHLLVWTKVVRLSQEKTTIIHAWL